MSNRLNQIITIEIKPSNNKTSSIKNDMQWGGVPGVLPGLNVMIGQGILDMVK